MGTIWILLFVFLQNSDVSSTEVSSAGSGPSSAGSGTSSAGSGTSSAESGSSSAGSGTSSAGSGTSSAGSRTSSAGSGTSSAGSGATGGSDRNFSGHAAFLLNQALFPEDYSNEVRPRIEYKSTVDVTIEMVINSIANLDEINQILYTDATYHLEWSDDFLSWSPTDFDDITHIVYPANKIWLPDVGIANSASTFTKLEYSRDFRVLLNDRGKIFWSFGGIIDTICSLDLTYYPFDRHNCTIVIENWAYTVRDVKIIVKEAEIKVASDFSPNGLWSYKGSYVTNTTFEKEVQELRQYPRITYTIDMQRKSQYYLTSIIGPCILLIILTLASFWLPPDSGEKVSLGITIILAFSVYQIIIEGQTPANSDSRPVLTTFVSFLMGLTCYSTLVSIGVLYIFHKSSACRVPYYFRVFFFKICAKALCMNIKISNDDCQILPIEEKNNRASMVVEDLVEKATKDMEQDRVVNSIIDKTVHVKALYDIRNLLRTMHGKMSEREREELITDEWKALARVTDRISFCLVLLTVIIGSFVCFGFVYFNQ